MKYLRQKGSDILQGKTHVLVGTTTLLAVALKYPQGMEFAHNVVNPVIGMLAVSAGSYAPDIDIQQSHLGKKYHFISKHFTHRGITHTLLAPFLMYCLIYTDYLPCVVNSLIFGFMFGWVVHILADLLNRKGVPIFWPLLTSKFHVMCIKTGTMQETIFTMVWLIGCVAYAYFNLL